MCKMGVDHTKAINETIVSVINSPMKRISSGEAKKILRNCGILDAQNQIKKAYQNIIIKTSSKNND